LSPRRRRGTYRRGICNLYSLTIKQAAFVRAMREIIGSMPMYAGVFPDYATLAPDAPGEFDLSHL